MVDPRLAAAAFCVDAGTCPITPLGRGNINDTFLIRSSSGPFVLQRINRGVFPDPRRVVNNFYKITKWLREKENDRMERFHVAQPVPTLAGALFFQDGQADYWRSQTYLPHISHQTLTGKNQAFQVGKALAVFHRRIAELDIESLEEPLPGFHNLPRYVADYDSLPGPKASKISRDMEYCLAMIESGRSRAGVLEEAKRAGFLATQAIHGDPKIDNFLFDDQGQAEGMLDLDTVGPGIVHYDLGDCLRSSCNQAGEVDDGNAVVSFDTTICRALLEGYFCGFPKVWTKGQKDLIFDAVMLITFELGVRFFTDHLRGDSYFKVRTPGENLTRAVRQFRLAEAIIAQESAIRTIAHSA